MKLILLSITSILIFSCGNINLDDVKDAINGKTDGLEANEHRIFVSSQTYDGNLGGLVGADAKCGSLAQAAGLSRDYKAMLAGSTINTNLEDRYIVNGPIYVFESDAIKYKVAEDDETWGGSFLDAHTSGGPGLLSTVHYTENYVDVEGDYHWTGADDIGEQDGDDCNGWNSNSSGGLGRLGINDVQDEAFFDENELACNTQQRLICISQ